MRYLLLLCVWLFWVLPVFAQESYSETPLHTYIQWLENDRLPMLWVYVSSVRATTEPGSYAYIVLTDALQDIQTLVYTRDVVVPEWYAVMSKELLRTILDTFESSWWSQAPIMLIEFADFQCPYCQQQAKKNVLENTRSAYPEDVRTVFAQFPLGWKYHTLAQSAAVAMECVYDQAGLEIALAFKNISFATSLQPTMTRMLAYISELRSVDEDEFVACVEGNETLQRVGAHKQIGLNLWVRWTPYTTVLDTRTGAYITLWWVQSVDSLRKHVDTFIAQ